MAKSAWDMTRTIKWNKAAIQGALLNVLLVEQNKWVEGKYERVMYYLTSNQNCKWNRDKVIRVGQTCRYEREWYLQTIFDSFMGGEYKFCAVLECTVWRWEMLSQKVLYKLYLFGLRQNTGIYESE